MLAWRATETVQIIQLSPLFFGKPWLWLVAVGFETAGFPPHVHVGQSQPHGGPAQEVRHPGHPALGGQHQAKEGCAYHAAGEERFGVGV